MYSEKFRIIAIQMYYKLKSYQKVCNFLKISKSTLSRWRNNGIKRKKRRVFATKYNIDLQNWIINFISINPFTTINDIQKSLLTTTNYSLSIPTISSFIRKIGFSRKKAYHYNINRFKNKQKEENFKIAIKEKCGNEIYSIDECYFSERLLTNYGYTKKGIKLQSSKVPPHYNRHSLLLAISSLGNYFYIIVPKSINKIKFHHFLEEHKILKEMPTLLDNVAFHHSCKLDNFIFTPPYQPEYNPIELCFSKIKNRFRKINTLKDNSLSVIEMVHLSIKDTLYPIYIQNCFKHVMNNFVLK